MYVCSPAHRVSRPRGTGSVEDSVGEGSHFVLGFAVFERHVLMSLKVIHRISSLKDIHAMLAAAGGLGCVTCCFGVFVCSFVALLLLHCFSLSRLPALLLSISTLDYTIAY